MKNTKTFIKVALLCQLSLFVSVSTSCTGGIVEGAALVGAALSSGSITGVISMATGLFDTVSSLIGLPQKDGQINFDGLDFSLKDKEGNQIGTPVKITDNKITLPSVPEDKAEDVQFAINDGDKEVLTGNLDGQDLASGSFTITEKNVTTNITDSNVIENSNNTVGGDATNVIIEDGQTGDIQIGDNTTKTDEKDSE